MKGLIIFIILDILMIEKIKYLHFSSSAHSKSRLVVNGPKKRDYDLLTENSSVLLNNLF